MLICEHGVDMQIGIPLLPARCASAVRPSFMCKYKWTLLGVQVINGDLLSVQLQMDSAWCANINGPYWVCKSNGLC